MKRINISSPTAQLVAQIAVFERLQATFKLHPGEMAKYFKELAEQRGEDSAKMTSELKPKVVAEFRRVLVNTVAMSSGGVNKPVEMGCGVSEIVRGYFDLSSIRILSDVVSKCEAQKLDVDEFLTWLQEVTPGVVSWAFDETVKILKRKD